MPGSKLAGPTVDAVHVYDWALPEDCGPLEQNIRRIAAGEVDVAMFTSANQVLNLLKLADELGIVDELRAGFRNIVVASIGPTTSEMLRNEELPVDMEPTHPKMGHLVTETAERAGELLARKRVIAKQRCRFWIWDFGLRIGRQHPHSALRTPKFDSPFLRACRREPTAYTPIWLMRQAGRYMPEYRQIRADHSFLDLCRNPQLCSEIMCTAVELLGRRCGDCVFRFAADS